MEETNITPPSLTSYFAKELEARDNTIKVLQERLEALESLLRENPPHVHIETLHALKQGDRVELRKDLENGKNYSTGKNLMWWTAARKHPEGGGIVSAIYPAKDMFKLAGHNAYFCYKMIESVTRMQTTIVNQKSCKI